MGTYKRYTGLGTLPKNSSGAKQANLYQDDNQSLSLNEAIELLTRALVSKGGVIEAGTVTLLGSSITVKNRLGITTDGKLLLEVISETLDLSTLGAGAGKHLVVIGAGARTTSNTYTDTLTQESITDVMTVALGKLGLVQGGANYPAAGANQVAVARVTKSGTAWTLDSEVDDAPTGRDYLGSRDIYLELGWNGTPDASAVSNMLIATDITISSADPGETGDVTDPAADFEIDIQVNGVSKGSVTIATDGTVTWSVSADIVLAAGDWLTLVAPSTADTTISDPHVVFRGVLT